jgi:hypothetical protein
MIPIKCFLLVALLLAGWIEKPATPRQLDPYAVLPGTWGWEGSDDCTASPQRLRFSADRRHMLLSLTPKDEHDKRAARLEATYRLLGDVPNGLRMSLAGEKRVDAHGNPVTWDLMLLDSNQYCWHRSDWPGTGCTRSVVRCEAKTKQ